MAGDRDRGGWLLEGEGRAAWEAKYRLVQALKAAIRLAAAVAHPGRLTQNPYLSVSAGNP